MIRFRSTISRITALHIIAVMATCIGMPIALYFRLESTANTLMNVALEEQAQGLAEHLTRTVDGGWILAPTDEIRILYSTSYGRFSFSVTDENRNVIASSNRNLPVVRSDPHQPDPYFFERWVEKKHLMGGSFPFEIDGQKVWVQVAQDMAHRDSLVDDIVDEFFMRVGWVTAPILVLLLIFEIAVIRRGMRPMVAASAMAADIGPSRVDIRIPEQNMPNEILPLVRKFNEALDRLEYGFQMQREFTADAAHELRTPLSVIQLRIDTIKDPELAESLRQDVSTMIHVVNQLIEIAELENYLIDADEITDLNAISRRMATFLTPLANAQNKTIAVHVAAEPVLIRGQSGLLAQAVRNLIDNALIHTPVGTAVEVTVTDTPSIQVRDYGQGVSETDRQKVFERYWRGDRKAAGSGLGLSIVSKILAVHTASISVENAEGAGAIFTIRFSPDSRVMVERAMAES